MDPICHAVKMVTESCSGQVAHRNPHVLYPWVGRAGVAEGGIYDQGDAFLRHEGSIQRGVGSTQEQGGCDLRDRHVREL